MYTITNCVHVYKIMLVYINMAARRNSMIKMKNGLKLSIANMTFWQLTTKLSDNCMNELYQRLPS